jgi:single-strand DNA-binding protein
MLCKNRITLIGHLGQDADTRSSRNGNSYTRLSLATHVSWKERGSTEYNSRTEWHRIVSWNKLGEWARALKKGVSVEVEGELRYREYTPTDSDRSVGVAEVYATSSLVLDRTNKHAAQENAAAERVDEPID